MKTPILITRLIFPDKCLLCRKLLMTQHIHLCDHCETHAPVAMKLKQKIPFLSGAFALWYYEGSVRTSILRYKFGHKRSYARDYGAILAGKFSNVKEQYDLIAWVPVSRLRKLRRGFDQAELIARIFCSELSTTPTPCLKKVRHNPPQSGIASAAQRRANVLGAYKVIDPNMIKGKRILLFDDIITTGATISECAKTLMAAGAKEVYGVAIATTRQHKSNQ